MAETFRALRSRNYRLFFGGQTLSLIGSWMETVATSWLVYRLTGSEFWLGVVAFASQIPNFAIAPFAGVVTDRVDRRRLLITTQSLYLAQAVLVTTLVLTNVVKVWELIAISVFAGVVGAFDTPGRQAFVIEMVEDRRDMMNAIALNSTQFNIARLIGPAIAGIVIKIAGEGICFLINAISFLAVVGALLAMRMKPKEVAVVHANPIHALVEGAVYVWNMKPIRAMLLLIAIASFTSGAYQVLMPVYAKVEFKGDSSTLGYMYMAVGVGALTSALLLANRTSVLGLGTWIVRSAATFGVGLIVFAFSTSLPMAFVGLAMIGLGAMMHMGSTNTMIQTIVVDRMRGRAMSFYAMSFIGTMPIGSLVTGAVARQVGNRETLIIAGAITFSAAMLFWRSLPGIRGILRPIYEEKGILQAEVAVE